jgi:hypothetical protein
MRGWEADLEFIYSHSQISDKSNPRASPRKGSLFAWRNSEYNHLFCSFGSPSRALNEMDLSHHSCCHFIFSFAITNSTSHQWINECLEPLIVLMSLDQIK